MKLPRVIKACLYVSAWSLFFLNPLRADVSVATQVSGDRVITGKFNQTNEITIITTFTGNHALSSPTGYGGGYVKLWINVNEYGVPPDVGGDWAEWTGKTSGISNGLATIVVSDTELQTRIAEGANASPQRDHFDFKVKYMKPDGSDDLFLEINDWGAAGGGPYLTFDNEPPEFGTNTGSFFNTPNSYFNSPISITIQPNENLLGTGDAYKSYIKLHCDYGDDFGNDHYYYLSNNEILKENPQTITNPSFTTSNGSTPFALVDNSRYDVTVYLYDHWGNLGDMMVDNDDLPDGTIDEYENQNFDTTLPTVSRITTSEGTDPITKKVGEKVYFRIFFSEAVTADQAVTVTFETHASNDGTATIAAWGTADIDPLGIFTVSAGDESSHLTINTIGPGGGGNITDQAGNNMAVFDIPALNNLNNVSVISVDGVLPTLVKMTAAPDDDVLAEGETTDITAQFSEVVTLTGTINLVLNSNLATTLSITTMVDGVDDNSKPVSSGTVTYTVLAGDFEATALDISSIALSNGGKITDGGGNFITSVTIPDDEELKDNTTLTVETVKPVISTIETTSGTGTYGAGATIPIKLKFKNGSAGGAADETVELTGTGKINVGVGAAANGGIATFSRETPHTTFLTGTYTVGDDDTEGAITVESVELVSPGTLKDVAGNTAILTLPGAIFTGKTITIDNTKPFLNTITTSTPETPTKKIGDPIVIQLNFDNPIDLSAGKIIATMNTTPTPGTAEFTSPQSGITTLTSTYIVGEGESAATLDITSVAFDPVGGGTLTDDIDQNENAIDPSAGFTPQVSFTVGGYNIEVDGTYPAIDSVSSSTIDGAYGLGVDISLTVHFTEEVTSATTFAIPVGLTANVIFPAITTAATSASATYTILAGDESAALAVTDPAVTTDNDIKDVALNPLQPAGRTLPASKNLTTVNPSRAIIVDGVLPVAPVSISVAPAGGSAILTNSSDYTAYFNATNTGVSITVDFDNAGDTSMEGGKIRIEGSADGNSWTAIASDHSITSNEYNSPTRVAIINVDSSFIWNNLSGFAHGQPLTFRAYNLDVASNRSILPSSASSALTIDLEAPSLVSITSDDIDDHYNEGESFSLVANFNDGDGDTDVDDQVSLINNATLDLTMTVGASAQSITAITNSASGTVTYTVGNGADHYSSSKVFITGVALSAADKLRDKAGNIVGTAGATTFSLVGVTNLDDGHNIYADGLYPAAPTIFSVTTDVNPVSGYWNADNTTAVFVVTLVNDPSMIGGKVTLLARTGSYNYAAIGIDPRPLVTTNQSNGTENVSITITETHLLAITGWPTTANLTGNVDFKIRSEDLAGNTTDTEDASKVTIFVDEFDPGATNAANQKPIIDMITEVSNPAPNSVAIQGYWNIDTDYLKVDIGNLNGLDQKIEGGKAQLFGKIDTFDWDTLGSVKSISSGNYTNFYIIVTGAGDLGDVGPVDNAAPYGIKELQKGGGTWDNMNTKDIKIKARIFDAAGNSTDYENTIVFSSTGLTTIKIDGTNDAHRPYIKKATAVNANGWWGPKSNDADLPIPIQIIPTEDITVNIIGSRPSIKLATGTVVGVAEYFSGVDTLIFNYRPGVDETTLANDNGGCLQFKLTGGEAIIDLNGSLMHSLSGNFLKFGNSNTSSPVLPKPNDSSGDELLLISLDESKNLVIDGVDPYYVSSSENTMYIETIRTTGDEQRTGYYNYRSDDIYFRFYYRRSDNPTHLDHAGQRVDMSLATNEVSFNCNSANDCATIQIKAEAVPENATPVEYGALGDAFAISYNTLIQGDDYLYQEVSFDASPTSSAIEDTDFEKLDAVQIDGGLFTENSSLTFYAVITDLAGNQTETVVYGTATVVDQSAPAPAGTTGNVDTDVDSTSNDISTQNIVTGYWNSHNTGVRITAPLLDDETLVGGAVQILGKVTTNADWTRLGVYNVYNGNYDASYNIDSPERNSLTSTVPSATTSLADTVDDGWIGVEEIPGFAEGAELSFAARVFDVAGNYTDWAPSATTLIVDETAPTIKEVRSASVERAYKEGETLYINLITTENITAPQGVGNDNSTLELLNTNGVNPTIPFRNASQDTVYYTYLVDSDESSEDTDPLITTADRLNYAATTSLDVKATGALIDPAGNNLATLLPTVAGDSALAQKKNIIIDTDAPGVTFNYFETTTATTDSSDSLVSHHDEKLIIHATFTDSIQIDSIPTLAINAPVGQGGDITIGDIASADMTRIGSWKYEYEYVLNLTDTVNGGFNITPTAYDKAGNLIDQSAVVDSGIVYMDNDHPEFISFTPDSNSYVNSGQVAYDLSENLRSASITWERIPEGGSEDNITHKQDLEGNELDIGLVENIELHDLNDPPVGLNDGTIYKVTWFSEDSAGNTTSQIATPVTYDITNPKVYLDYTLDAIRSSELDTIEATFSEPTKSIPKISIDYLTSIVTPGDIDTENMTIDTVITDLTKWFYIARIPTIGEEICSTNVEIDASDRAGNTLLSTNTFHLTGPQNIDTLASDILIVDNSKPICTVSYENTTQNWLTDDLTGDLADFNNSPQHNYFYANGKAGDLIKITASLDEKFGTPNTGYDKPTLDVTFNYPVPPAVSSTFDSSSTSLLKDSLGFPLNNIYDTPYIFNDDSTFVWYLELPDTTTGAMIVTVNGTDRALNPIKTYVGPRWTNSESDLFDSSFVIDNFFPDTTYSTGAAASYGYNPKSGWINGITDSIGVWVPIPSVATDPSLFNSSTGGLHIELWNKTRGAGWVNIPNLQEPYADSIAVGQTTEFYRTMAEVEAVLVPEAGLVQGDSIYIRAAIADRVGNKTSADTSATIFVYDPYFPTVSNINGGNVLTVDTLYSEESLSASWTGSSDSTWNSIPGSGILNYDYQIGMHDSDGDSLDTLVAWTSVGLNESANLTELRMLHNHMYSFNIRAVDTAGNVSATVSSDTIYRKNSAPIISVDSTIKAYEDGLYTDTVKVIDLDLATALSDSFDYFITWKDSIWPTNAKDSVNIDDSGVITWTPTPQDTGNFRLEVVVVDKDTLSDTLDYPLKVLPVNDPPYFRSGADFLFQYKDTIQALRMPDISFDENDSFEVYLTQYIHDEDNNDTAIVWTYELDGAIVPDSSFPIMSPFIGPLTPAQQRTLPSGHQMQNKLKTVETRMSAKSLADTIQIVITQNDTGSTAKIQALYDYNTSNSSHSIVFKPSDEILNINPGLHDTIFHDTLGINLNINAINDAPKWKDGFPPDTTMMENDTFRIVLGNFVDDVDDNTLLFKLKATPFGKYAIYDSKNGNVLDSLPGIMGIDSSEYVDYAPGDDDSTALFIPTKLWSGSAEIEAIVTDGIDNPQNPKSDTTKFIIDVIRVPRPRLAFDIIQNNVFTGYFDFLITDTMSKAMNMVIAFGTAFTPTFDTNNGLEKVGPFTYRFHKKYLAGYNSTVQIRAVATAFVGLTVDYSNPFTIEWIRSSSSWTGSSPDGLFNITGEVGAVSRDQFIMIMDSTMINKGYSGSYKLGDEGRWFSNQVEVSLASYDDEQALYQRNSDNSWTELPSYSQQGRIKAYTDKMGYFRLGRKTVIVPGLTSLGQNYPNPFNPVTNITYDVGFVDGPQQQVNLSIYNLLGQHVQTLFRGQQGPGQYSIMWYGRDKSGVSVASGIYFVHMTTSAGEVQTKKVMLLR